jgi:alcohol dehydrogenase class IV
MIYEFATATRIIFGRGAIQQTGSIIEALGKKALVVTGKSEERATPLLLQLRSNTIEWVVYCVSSEPSIQIIQAGIEKARQHHCDMVVSIGGGSALDAGKAIAILVTNSGDIYDYLEVIGKGLPFRNPALPFIAIPTTAGTGTEVTRNSVLFSPEHQVKVSLRSALMLPRVAIVDPQLTYDLPAEITVSTGLDALTQLIEPFVSSIPNPLTDPTCREGILKASRSLKKVYENGNDYEAREAMSLASLFGGLALANAKLGAIHGFAGPIGGMFPAPHGMICASLLPYVFEANINAIRRREPKNPALERFLLVSRWLTGKDQAKLEDGIAWLFDLCKSLNVPSLRDFSIPETHLQLVVEKAKISSSMRGNPIKLSDDEMMQILIRAL